MQGLWCRERADPEPGILSSISKAPSKAPVSLLLLCEALTGPVVFVSYHSSGPGEMGPAFILLSHRCNVLHWESSQPSLGFFHPGTQEGDHTVTVLPEFLLCCPVPTQTRGSVLRGRNPQSPLWPIPLSIVLPACLPIGAAPGGQEGAAATRLCPGAADHLCLGAGLQAASLQPGPGIPHSPGSDPTAPAPVCPLDPPLWLGGPCPQPVPAVPASEAQVCPRPRSLVVSRFPAQVVGTWGFEHCTCAGAVSVIYHMRTQSALHCLTDFL